MKIKFDNRQLENFYYSGKSKRYRIQRNIFKRFSMRVQQLEASASTHDLMINTGLRFKKLEGTKKNIYSVRVNDTYRLEFQIQWEDEQHTKGTIIIMELSKHYGD